MTGRGGDTGAGRDFPAVDGVTAAAYEIPTDQPEADGTLAWSSTTLVVAHVSGGGQDRDSGTPTRLPRASR